MLTGDCFRCNQPGHWANNCPLKTTTKPAASAASPPVIHCPCNGGACKVFTSTTAKNPNRRFYKCPSIPSCGYFKWCDQVSIIKSESISVHPTCPCGSGPCRRVTVTDGPNAQRSYFVCSLKKNFGACGFFQWEDDVQTQPESEQVRNDGSPCPTLIGYSGFDSVNDESLLLHQTGLDSDGNVKRSRLGVVVESDLNPTSSTTLGNRVVDRIAQPMKDTLPMNSVTVEKESIPVFAGFNNRKLVSNGVFASADGTVPSFDLITSLYEDAVHRETVLPSSCLMDLIEQYNSEKLHFKCVSVKYVEALKAFTGSYKKLESLRDRAHSFRKELREVEKQVKFCEAETSEFAMSLQEVSGEMAKLQKKMVETAGKLAQVGSVKMSKGFTAP